MAHHDLNREQRGDVDDTTPRYTLAEIVDMLFRMADEDERNRARRPPREADPNSQRREFRGSDTVDGSSVNDPGDRRYWDNVSPGSSFMNTHLPPILPDPSLAPSSSRRQQYALSERVSTDREVGGRSTDSGTYYSSRASSPDRPAPPPTSRRDTTTNRVPSSCPVSSSGNPYHSLVATSALLASAPQPAPTTRPVAASRVTASNDSTPRPRSYSVAGNIATSVPHAPAQTLPATPTGYSTLHTESKGKAREAPPIPIRTTSASASSGGPRPEPSAVPPPAPVWPILPRIATQPSAPKVVISAPENPASARASVARTPARPSYKAIFSPESDSADWYAITHGRRVGVVDNNSIAVASCSGISGFSMKVYKTRAEAMKHFRAAEEMGFVSEARP